MNGKPCSSLLVHQRSRQEERLPENPALREEDREDKYAHVGIQTPQNSKSEVLSGVISVRSTQMTMNTTTAQVLRFRLSKKSNARCRGE